MNLALRESYEVNPSEGANAASRGKVKKEIKVEINDLLQVQIPDDPNSLSYRSRVDDIAQGRIQIAWPTDRGVRIPIHRNQTLTLSFAREDAIYSFSGIAEETRRAPLAQIWIVAAGPPERIQRRQFFRVKSLLPVELYGEQVIYEGKDVVHKAVAIKTKTYEISGAGLSVLNQSSIQPGTLLDCKLKLESEKATLHILCKVVHSSQAASSTGAAIYHIGMFFLTIKEADRTRIVRHVFRVELG